ncbi:hypothetical protein P7C70_g2894, partial [Phenoliferia sp. Uapishka_3]
MAPPSPALLKSLSATLRRPSAGCLIPALVSTTLGHGSTWLPLIYAHHTSSLPPSPPKRSSSPFPVFETVPRRRVLRELKEALVKSAILVGVPKALEGMLELQGVIEKGDHEDWFVREGLGRGVGGAEEVEKAGEMGLARIYRGDIKKIWETMGDGMLDASESIAGLRGVFAADEMRCNF